MNWESGNCTTTDLLCHLRKTLNLSASPFPHKDVTLCLGLTGRSDEIMDIKHFVMLDKWEVLIGSCLLYVVFLKQVDVIPLYFQILKLRQRDVRGHGFCSTA